jgi:hypothetical protein
MTQKKDLIVGGHLQFRTGLESVANAGTCVLSGVPLVRACVTEHVARIDRREKGIYEIMRADGCSGGEIEATDRRQALLKWQGEEITSLRGELAEAVHAYNEAIDANAIRLVLAALKNDGSTPAGGWVGCGYRGTPDGVAVRTNDLFRFAQMMGLVCHLRNNRIFVGATESEVGKKMHAIYGSGAEE